MKKLLAFVLALGLAVSASVTAFAEDATTTETNDSTKSTEIAVNGSYQAATPAGSSISVDVVWEDMSFTYTGESKGAWDPKTHQYGDTIEAHWAWSSATEEQTAPNITLTNHSDTGVKATFAFNPEVSGLNGTFTGTDGSTLTENALTLGTAVETDPASAPSAVTSFSVGGSGIDSNKQLGSITVTVAKDGATGGDTSPEAQVGDKDALNAAVDGKKKTITLTADIALTSTLCLMNNYTGTIDLNYHKLSNDGGGVIDSLTPATPSIKNGTLESTNSTTNALSVGGDTTVTVDNCTIKAETAPALFVAGTAALHDCTIQSTGNTYALEFVNKGHLTLSGMTNIIVNSVDTYDTDGSTNNSLFKGGSDNSLTCLAGTYNFDPTPYVNQSTYKIIPNAEKSTWTVTTRESTGEETPTTPGIDTFEELKAAVDSSTTGSEVITLGGNIDAGTSLLTIPEKKEVTIDLGGYTLTGAGYCVIENKGTVTIKNGTIVGANNSATIVNEHSLTADGLTVNNTKDQVIEAKNAEKTELTKCNLSSTDYSVIHLYACGATIVDCTLTSSSKTAIRYSDNGATAVPMITIGGNTTINDYIVANTGSTCYIDVQGGCSFDPSEHYNKNINTLTKDGTGIWMLTYGTAASTDSE